MYNIVEYFVDLVNGKPHLFHFDLQRAAHIHPQNLNYYPFITPMGFSRATRRARPALWTTSMTASTSL
jgi:hypothetical protein